MTDCKRKSLGTLYGCVPFIFIWVMGIVFCFGQDVHKYHGPYTLNGYEGNARFGYKIVGIDTLLEGPFRMERSNLGELLRAKDTSFLITGNFKENIPTGPWLFQFGEFNSDSTSSVSDFQYKVNVNGKLKEAKGTLDTGMFHGKWGLIHTRVRNSQVLDTLFRSELLFEQGVPSKSFTMTGSSGALVGRCLENGLSHDVWSLFSKDANAVENWYFNEGRLERIERVVDGRTIRADAFNTSSQYKTVPLDKRFLTLLAIYTELSMESFDEESAGIGAMLLRNEKAYGPLREILMASGAKEPLSNFKVKIPYKGFGPLEKQQLDSIGALVSAASEKGEALLGNTRLNIIKRSDKQVNGLFNSVVQLTRGFVEPLKELARLNELGIVESIGDNYLGNHLFPTGLPSPDPSGADGTRDVDWSRFDQGVLQGLLEMAKYTATKMDHLTMGLNDQLARDLQAQEITFLEERMLQLANGMAQFPDSIQMHWTVPQKEALDSIKDKTEESLEDYAKLDTGEQKLDSARSLANCLQQMDQLASEIAHLHKHKETLAKKYKDAVWNPFTATIMQETVKKRLVNAYGNVAVPYLLEQVKNNLDCDNTATLYQAFCDINERMYEFRDKDTSKLERRLKKGRNPSEVLQLFNITPLDN